jgi:hypothetical protein
LNKALLPLWYVIDKLVVLTSSRGAPAWLIVTVRVIPPPEIVREALLTVVAGLSSFVVTEIVWELVPERGLTFIQEGIPVISQETFAEVISKASLLPFR